MASARMLPKLGLQVLNIGSSTNVIEGIQANHEMVRTERADRLMADMQRWLNASDISVQHNDTINKQHSNTGNWFIRGPAFSSWHAKFSNTYIILDGLDECPRKTGRGCLLKAIEEIRGWSDSRLHLLVSSRDEPDIRDYLRLATHEEVKINNVDFDIETFVTGTLRNNRNLQRILPHSPRFRWVECMLTALESCPVVEARVKSLFSSVPYPLCETYERMLLDVEQGFLEDARSILTLLCSAERSLTVAEVDGTLRMGLGAEDILLCCPGLVVIEHNQARLVHSSVREYLQSENLAQAKFRASNFWVRNVPAQSQA
ncbi:hypothetical protein QC764_208490 [Podospora pseudoanserina]|uniref:NACHT domain-containing protein n=1 Tax=Podospora pseudoanserina TaxID=2609844 RepID=A0ABR0IIG4_9PEZI|nr:hypothetical protein QC764_208490 [Podospora pseudoanserina]